MVKMTKSMLVILFSSLILSTVFNQPQAGAGAGAGSTGGQSAGQSRAPSSVTTSNGGGGPPPAPAGPSKAKLVEYIITLITYKDAFKDCTAGKIGQLKDTGLRTHIKLNTVFQRLSDSEVDSYYDTIKGSYDTDSTALPEVSTQLKNDVLIRDKDTCKSPAAAIATKAVRDLAKYFDLSKSLGFILKYFCSYAKLITEAVAYVPTGSEKGQVDTFLGGANVFNDVRNKIADEFMKPVVDAYVASKSSTISEAGTTALAFKMKHTCYIVEKVHAGATKPADAPTDAQIARVLELLPTKNFHKLTTCDGLDLLQVVLGADIASLKGDQVLQGLSDDQIKYILRRYQYYVAADTTAVTAPPVPQRFPILDASCAKLTLDAVIQAQITPYVTSTNYLEERESVKPKLLCRFQKGLKTVYDAQTKTALSEDDIAGMKKYVQTEHYVSTAVDLKTPGGIVAFTRAFYRLPSIITQSTESHWIIQDLYFCKFPTLVTEAALPATLTGKDDKYPLVAGYLVKHVIPKQQCSPTSVDVLKTAEIKAELVKVKGLEQESAKFDAQILVFYNHIKAVSITPQETARFQLSYVDAAACKIATQDQVVTKSLPLIQTATPLLFTPLSMKFLTECHVRKLYDTYLATKPLEKLTDVDKKFVVGYVKKHKGEIKKEKEALAIDLINKIKETDEYKKIVPTSPLAAGYVECEIRKIVNPTSTDSESGTKSDKALTTPQIIGIAVGCVFAVAAIVAIVFFCIKKNR